jgi:hypothetical protein
VHAVNQKADSTVEREKITIRPWQFCEGCKVTVDAYANRSSTIMTEMKTAGLPSGSDVNANAVAKGLCSLAAFETYETFIKNSCVKIINEFELPFLKVFEGSMLNDANGIKADMFEKRREVR